MAVISVRGLRKRYGDREAVRGVDLDVHAGEVFAFLGPNGAGKTTTVEILEGFRARDGGEVRVLGADPARVDARWRARVGVVLQTCRLAPELTVRETVAMYAGYYLRRRPVEEAIDLVGLADAAGQRVETLSGGQQRRLDVALALIGQPELVFLDEPTTGFDPSARRAAWELIGSLRALGTTVFLTTHYMDEAETLADRLAIIADGRIVAEGTPRELRARADGGAEIAFRLIPGASAPEVRGLEIGDDGCARLRAAEPVAALHALTGWALERGIDLPELELRRPTLEDVYLRLTHEEA